MKFYDFPAYWKNNDIYEMLKKVGYIERLEVKWNYKYRTVRAKIRLTKEMEEIFLKGGSNNIALTKNERTYFFRMFDAKLNASAIKKRYEWQAYRKLDNEESEKKEHEIIKDYNAIFGDKFVDAKSDILSTIPRTQEEHKELNNLNNSFSERLEDLEEGSSLPNEKEKTIEDKDRINKNKKCIVMTQGRRDDSDSE
ncbi:hypothetical protein RhiirA4_424271 [Rhizophagus irregularis]|uniref:Uncharacterized protein n=1 Tax=Rhizophagus irregularis TaxID=588596 RepID=A0A2I1GWW3_9GLOM|nr:hypothetical protein RhiirA4_424271 [Rhizophagus irregularis]